MPDFTIEMIKEFLRFYGVWRAKISDKRDGSFEILIPITAHKRHIDWFHLTFPVGIICEVGILENPLQYKKYTYIVGE
ncbi:hypothetical protein VPGG_00006 [Vibrio phage VBM1]|uniref:hypothetical protein n=1 Tax=Vibrio phage VBM1 TaxID=754074 RepID=UPI0002C14B95|nr:hypothetical protein VPGG_00006 [Vibrio phage VBM1]AGH07323.1 hypothetical protein VPGG_00006 [Vibrio phage VBM1]